MLYIFKNKLFFYYIIYSLVTAAFTSRTKKNNFENFEYTFHTEAKVTARQASEICNNDGGVLANPKTQKENDFISNQLQSFKTITNNTLNNVFWIGLNRNLTISPSKWKWSDGELLDNQLDFNWIKKPSKFELNKTCVGVFSFEKNKEEDYYFGKWVSLQCEEFMYFICQTKKPIASGINSIQKRKMNVTEENNAIYRNCRTKLIILSVVTAMLGIIKLVLMVLNLSPKK